MMGAGRTWAGVVLVVALAVDVAAEVRVGILGAFTISDFEQTDSTQAGEILGPRPSWSAGGFAELATRRVFLRVEPRYIIKSSRLDASKEDFNEVLHVLEIPLLFGVSWGSDRRAVFFKAGPSLGFRLDGWEEDAYDSSEKGPLISDGVDVGICLGGGIAFRTASVRTFIDVQYIRGGESMTLPVRYYYLQPPGSFQARAQTLQFAAGVAWSLGQP